jgi:hypothetical protein
MLSISFLSSLIQMVTLFSHQYSLEKSVPMMAMVLLRAWLQTVLEISIYQVASADLLSTLIHPLSRDYYRA